MKHIVLYSGGPDSFITFSWVSEMFPNDEIIPAYVALGHRYQDQELSAVLRTIPYTLSLHGMESLGKLEMRDAYIPQRNAHLVLTALNLLEVGEKAMIWLSVQQDETSLPDRSAPFFAAIQEVAHTLGYPVTVNTPWWDHDKTEMFYWYKSSGLSMAKLKRTHSCYTPGKLPCGDCAACIRRFIAMSIIGETEEYLVNPATTPIAEEYVRRAKAGNYSEKRCNRIIEVLGGRNVRQI